MQNRAGATCDFVDGRLVIEGVFPATRDADRQAWRTRRHPGELEVIYDIRHPDGRTEHHAIPYETSYMFRYELEHLLARCGFTTRNVWGGFGFEPFGEGATDELIVLAERISDALQLAAWTALVVFDCAPGLLGPR